MRIAPTRILLDVLLSQASWAALWLDAATMARPRPTRDPATRHPCLLAAFFLPCASRPPDVRRLRLIRPRRHYVARARATQRAYVTTRTDTMARRRQDTDEDEITESDDTADAATFGGSSLRGTRQVTPPSMPADLHTVLAMPLITRTPHIVGLPS